jgi:hypothetical protein
MDSGGSAGGAGGGGGGGGGKVNGRQCSLFHLKNTVSNGFDNGF